ncbi:MAG: hypothetical protein CMJ16_00370 [Peredibacter sp.]|nr:hypothetical protein [Peredibacter sp.]
MKTPKMIKTFALMAVLSPVAIAALSPSAVAALTPDAIAVDGLDDLREQRIKSMSIIKEVSTLRAAKIKANKIDFEKQVAADQQKIKQELRSDIEKELDQDIKKSISQIDISVPQTEEIAQTEDQEAPTVIVGKAKRPVKFEEVDLTQKTEAPTVIVGKAEKQNLEFEEKDLTQKESESSNVIVGKAERPNFNFEEKDLLQKNEIEESEASQVVLEKAERQNLNFNEVDLTAEVSVPVSTENSDVAESLKKVKDAEAQASEQAQKLEEQLSGEITEELISKVEAHNRDIQEQVLYIELLQEQQDSELSDEDKEGLAGILEVVSSLKIDVPAVSESEVSEVDEQEADEVIAESPEIERLRKKNQGLETAVCEQKSQIDLLGQEIEALKNAAAQPMDVMGMMQQLMIMNMMMNNTNKISYAENPVDTMSTMMAPMMMMQSMNVMMMQSMGLGMQANSTKDMYSKVNAVPQNVYNVGGNLYGGDYTSTSPVATQGMTQPIPYQGAPWAFDFNDRQPSFENFETEKESKGSKKNKEQDLDISTDEMIS